MPHYKTFVTSFIAILATGCAQSPNIISPDYKATRTFNDEEIAKEEFLTEGWLRKIAGQPSPSVAMLGAQYHFAHEFCKDSVSAADKDKVDEFHLYAATTGLRINFYTERYPEFLGWVREYASNYKMKLNNSHKDVGGQFCARYVKDAIDAFTDTPPRFASMDGPGFYRSMVFTLYFSRPDEKALQTAYRTQKISNIITAIGNPISHISFGKKDKVDIHDMRTQYFFVENMCESYKPFLLYKETKNHPIWTEYNSIQDCE